MAHSTFKQDIFIAAPHEIVQKQVALLMTNITETQPFVIWSRHLQTTIAEDGARVDHYRVRDRMKWGPFTIAFTYKVDMRATAEGKLISHAHQPPGVHLYNQTWCEPDGDGTRVREHIEITAPRFLMKMTCKAIATAHAELFENLKKRAEQTTV